MNNPSSNLDLLRSVAVSFVVISHLLLDRYVNLIGSYHTQTLGTLGVLIFFVHTCLVLMQSLDRQGQRYRHRSLEISFMIRRAFRIYPMSVVVVVLLTFIERAHSHSHPTLSVFLSNLFLVQNITDSPSITPVLWSLPFEFQMYFFLPVLYFLTNSKVRRASSWILALWFLSVVMIYAFWRLGWRADLIKFFPCFLPGVLAYCLRNKPSRWPAGVLFAYVGAMAIFYPTMVGLGLSATFLSWFICLALGLIIPECSEMKTEWLKVCASTIARYSYGIYLVHFPVLYFSFHYFKDIPLYFSWAIFICGVPALSYLAYHMIEKPGIELGQSLVDRMNVFRKASRA